MAKAFQKGKLVGGGVVFAADEDTLSNIQDLGFDSLLPPEEDLIVFFDASSSRVNWLTPGDNLAITDDQLDVVGLSPGDHDHDDRYYTETEVDTLLLGKSDTTHNHDGVYSPVGHDHDADYADINHNHDEDYAPLVHDHDGVYSPVGHDHDADYAAISHTHTESDITDLGNYLEDITSESIGDLSDVDLSTPPTDGQALVFDDDTDTWVPGTVASSGGTWGSITGTLSDQTDLQSALDGKSDTTHNHDTAYAAINHDHDADYAAIDHDHDTDYAPISHNHTVSDITDLVFPEDHGLSDLTDPNADRALFWDDSAGNLAWLTVGTGLQIVGTTLSATGEASGEATWGGIDGTLSDQTDLQSALDAKADIAGSETISGDWRFTGAVSIDGGSGDQLYIGGPGAKRDASAAFEIGGGTSSFGINVQDGSGRVNFRWNASPGPSPTYLASSEPALEWDMDVNSPAGSLLAVRHAAAGTATDPITWTTYLAVGTTTFQYAGNNVWHAGNLNPLGLQSLTDPNADRILFWDDSANALKWLALGSGLSITDTTLDTTGSGGASSLDELTDVTLTTPAEGEILTYDGMEWVNDDTLTVDAGVGVAVNGTGDNIVLNHDETGSPTRDAGIYVERGTELNAGIIWDETDDILRIDPADGAVNLYHAGIKSAETISGGIAAVKPADADGLIRIVDSDGNVRAEIGSRNSNDNLNIRNVIPGGTVVLNSLLSGGAATEALRIEPDNALMLFHPPNGASADPVLETLSNGVQVSGTLASEGGEGALQVTRSGVAAEGRFGLASGATLIIHNANHGAAITLRGEDEGGTGRNLFVGDPDGAATIYFNGGSRIQTNSVGANILNRVTAVGHTSADDSEGSRFGRSATQCVLLNGSAGGNRIVSLSDTNNSKSLIIRATTNAAGTAGTSEPHILIYDRQQQELARFWGNGGLTVGSPTGSDKGLGTINAQAVYDDNVLLCMPVEEALGMKPTREEWDQLSPTGKNDLVDRHEEHKGLGWDNTATGYVALMEARKSAPGLATKEEIAAQFDEEGEATNKFSIGTKVEHLWLALDYAAVAIRDLTKRVEELEAKLNDRKDTER